MSAFFISSKRRHTRCLSDWSSDVCSSDLKQKTAYERSEEHTSELQSLRHLVCRLLLEKNELGPEVSNFHGGIPQLFLNVIDRYDVSRGHSMGSLNGDHPELFLTDSLGLRVYSTAYSNPATDQYVYLMDFGSTAYHSYWLEAVKADIVNQPWVADGVFADNCIALNGGGDFTPPPH